MKRAFTGKRDIGLALASVHARSIEVVPRRTEGSEGRGGGDASTLFFPDLRREISLSRGL